MDTFLTILEWTAGLAALGWFLWNRVRNRDDTVALLLSRIAASGVIIYVLVRIIHPRVRDAQAADFIQGIVIATIGVCSLVLCGLLLGLIWRDALIDWFASLLSRVYGDGGEIEPKPLYSTFHAKRMASDFRGAIAAVRTELEKFPGDFDGAMLLAGLHAEDLSDLPAATRVLEDTLRQKNLAPGQIAYALNTLADWQVKYGRDSEAAHRSLERITSLLAGTEAAALAGQRIAHLRTNEELARDDEHQPVAIPEFDRQLGLRRRRVAVVAKPDLHAMERRLLDRIAQHPNDWQAREDLATAYVEQFEDTDRAFAELETLIASPGFPRAELIRCLHLKSSWEVKYRRDVAAGRAALGRVMELYPNTAAASRAALAMEFLQARAPEQQKSRGQNDPGEKAVEE